MKGCEVVSLLLYRGLRGLYKARWLPDDRTQGSKLERDHFGAV